MPTATFTPNSQQFDATRDEIIASFRQKIQQEARRKLSQVQLQELIEIFRTRLTSLPDPESIQQLCQAEIALLSEGYNPPSVANNYLPKYRQAIAVSSKSPSPLSQVQLEELIDIFITRLQFPQPPFSFLPFFSFFFNILPSLSSFFVSIITKNVTKG